VEVVLRKYNHLRAKAKPERDFQGRSTVMLIASAKRLWQHTVLVKYRVTLLKSRRNAAIGRVSARARSADATRQSSVHAHPVHDRPFFNTSNRCHDAMCTLTPGADGSHISVPESTRAQ